MQLMSILDSNRHVGTYSDGITVALSPLLGRSGGYSEDNVDPQVYLAEILTPNAVERAHFHEVDQFQIFVGGGGQFGKAPIEPVMVQYADAWTPYGPLIGGPNGYSFLTVRRQSSAGALYIPESRQQRRSLGGRQISQPFKRDELADPGKWSMVLGPYDDGVAAYGIVLGAGERTTLPDADVEQFCVVVNGTLRVDGRDHPVASTVRVGKQEEEPELEAGPDGATLVVVNFASSAES
jgi:hypothetical protein